MRVCAGGAIFASPGVIVFHVVCAADLQFMEGAPPDIRQLLALQEQRHSSSSAPQHAVAEIHAAAANPAGQESVLPAAC